MATFGVSMVRDEEDVIAGTLRHMADEVDHIIVADNGSTDSTARLLRRLAADGLPLTVLHDPEVGYYQSAKMTRLAARAADMGARWIVPFDADELWFAHDGRIREVLAQVATRDNVNVAVAQLTNHLCTALDPEGDDPMRTMVWRQRDPAPLPKVAFQWHPDAVIHQGNHGVDLPGTDVVRAPLLQVRHFPYRSAEQFTRKAVNGAQAYAAADLPQDMGLHWRAYGDLAQRFGKQVLGEVFREHFWYLSPTDSGLVLDPAPYLRWRT